MLRRIRNLWAWSNVSPHRTVLKGKNLLGSELRIPASIINPIDPADELIQTIRKENTSETS